MPGDFYNKETDAPLQAPKWTLGGYKGSLKAAIQEACKTIPGRVSEQRQPQEPPQDEPPQTADEARTPAPQVVTSDEPRTIPQTISSQTSADEPRVATQSSTDESRTATQPSSDELTQRIRSSLESAKKKKHHKKSK